MPEAAFDAVVSGMAFHWFPDKPGAVRAMARAVRPGGVVAILGSGRGSDVEFQRVLEAMRPAVPESWTTVFDLIHRDGRELGGIWRTPAWSRSTSGRSTACGGSRPTPTSPASSPSPAT